MTDRDWTDVDANRREAESAREGAGPAGTDVDGPRPAVDTARGDETTTSAPESVATDADAAREETEASRAGLDADGATRPAAGGEPTTAG